MTSIPILTRRESAKHVAGRLAFVLLTTAVLVFFSEKVYWYPQGFVLGELLLFYAVPTYACLWAIEYFRVRRLSALVLVAALFAFLVEGVLTPVIYEAGLFDPLMPAYFIGWHGLVSLLFGWYFLRKWLVDGRWRRLAAGSALFGLFWGLWSLTYWLPESAAEWADGSTQWTPAAFALYAFAFTLLLAASHWLLGRGGWQRKFQLSKAEKWIVALVLAALFALMVLPAVPLAIFKLAVMLAVVFGGVAINRRHSTETVLLDLAGRVQTRHIVGLFAMPGMATTVYALASFFPPSETAMRTIAEWVPLLQGAVGGALFLWAWTAVLWNRGGLSRHDP